MTWDLGTLDELWETGRIEGVVAVTVKVADDVPIGSSIHNRAEIWGAECEPVPPYNYGDWETTVVGESGYVILIEPLEITPVGPYSTEDTLTATFTVENTGNAAITLDKLLLGGRYDDGELPGGGYPDFTYQTMTLQPGQTHEYQGTFTIPQPGDYHFFIAYYIENPTEAEKEFLDDNNWNTCIELAEGLTDQHRTKDITVGVPGNQKPIALAASLGGQPKIMHPNIQCTVAAAYHDLDGMEDLKYCYLRLNHPTKPLTLMWNQATDEYSAWAGEEGADYITVTGWTVPMPDSGYDLNWQFTLNDAWPEVENAIDFGLFAMDDQDAVSGWDYDDTNASFLSLIHI